MYTLNELERQVDDEVVILKTSQCKEYFHHAGSHKVIDFKFSNPIEWIKAVYHLASSHTVFIDNYYGFLAAVNFRSNVKCVQLWHAAGAIKQFGLKDPSNKTRSRKTNLRFHKVYQRFDKIVVGSEKMAAIFQESFGVSNDKIMRTGIPRTDLFFDNQAITEIKNHIHQLYPNIKDKKVILYAPTYRDNELNVSDVSLDIRKLYNNFSDDYVLFLRLHPAVSGNFKNKFPDFVYNVSDFQNINHLLLVSDILVSDYSSIPFEFSLLGKPMVFFAYDLKDYENARGFWEDYENLVPGPVVRNTEELVEIIQSDKFDMEQIKKFANQWNQYSNGKSCERLITNIYTDYKQYEETKEAKINI